MQTEELSIAPTLADFTFFSGPDNINILGIPQLIPRMAHRDDLRSFRGSSEPLPQIPAPLVCSQLDSLRKCPFSTPKAMGLWTVWKSARRRVGLEAVWVV